LALVHQLPYKFPMQCPKCGYEFTDAEIVRESASIQGRRGIGIAKSRDPEKMREAGRLGGLAKARNRAVAAKAKKQKS
jgi:general stress protein YciG